jgi:hypothetical protein
MEGVMGEAEIEEILQGIQIGYVTAFDAHVLRAHIEDLRASVAAAEERGRSAEREEIVAWLRKNPGVPRAPECITAMTPFECADAIEVGRHQWSGT